VRVAARDSGLQKADEPMRGIARLVVAGLKYGQFLERSLASLFQFRSLLRADGTTFERKHQPQIKSALQFREGRWEAGMNRATSPLTANFARPSLETLLQFVVTFGEAIRPGTGGARKT